MCHKKLNLNYLNTFNNPINYYCSPFLNPKMSRKNYYQSGTSNSEHRLPSVYDDNENKLYKKRQQHKQLKEPEYIHLPPLETTALQNCDFRPVAMLDSDDPMDIDDELTNITFPSTFMFNHTPMTFNDQYYPTETAFLDPLTPPRNYNDLPSYSGYDSF